MATDFVDAVRLAVSLGADADTLGAIVGSIAEAIWGIPMSLRHQIEDYLPDEMLFTIDDFHRARPRSFKPLIDMTFCHKEFSEAGWDMLEDDEREELMTMAEMEKDKKLELMKARGKARENW